MQRVLSALTPAYFLRVKNTPLSVFIIILKPLWMETEKERGNTTNPISIIFIHYSQITIDKIIYNHSRLLSGLV